MEKFGIIIWLLPIVFMIHDFEKIIFFKSWISKNKDYLTEKILILFILSMISVH